MARDDRPIVAIVRVRAMVGSRPPPNANSDNDPSLLSLIVSVSPCPRPPPRRSPSRFPLLFFAHHAPKIVINIALVIL